MKQPILFLFLLTFQTVYSQVRIIDNVNGNPIAFAHIITTNGRIGTISDLNGKIDVSELLKYGVEDVEKITIQHVAYENLELTFGELKNTSTIKLNERSILLNEISISPDQKTDYIVLKGFFRSYQLNSNIPKYYTDGIIEYYIPVKGNSISFNVLEFRSFRNKKLIESQKNRPVSFEMKLAGVPYIESGVLLSEIKSKYTLNESGVNNDILISNSKVGYISENSKNKSIQICIDKIAPKTEKIYSFLGNTSKIKNIDVTENYFSTDFKTLSKELLESRKEYRKIYFKSKNADREELIEGVHEFYTFNVTYISKKQFKKIKTDTDTSLKESHFYLNEYWVEAIKKYNVSPLCNQIENELGKTLILY